MKRIVIEGKADLKSEDGGCALILEVSPKEETIIVPALCGQFVRFQSWCECGEDQHHPEWVRKAKGKTFKITIEEIK